MKLTLKHIFFAATAFTVAFPVLADDKDINIKRTGPDYSAQNAQEGMNRVGLVNDQTLTSTSSNAPRNDPAQKQPNNTAMNTRDRDSSSLTPLDQGNSLADTDTTAAIRKDVVALQGMSTDAQNVKIITKNGKVTLRGPVKTAEEKRLIHEIASTKVTPLNVDNQLEVVGQFQRTY